MRFGFAGRTAETLHTDARASAVREPYPSGPREKKVASMVSVRETGSALVTEADIRGGARGKWIRTELNPRFRGYRVKTSFCIFFHG